MMETDILHLQWREPLWLLLSLQPLLLVIISRLRVRRYLAVYADKPLLPWLLPHRLLPHNSSHGIRWPARKIAYHVAWILFTVAAAGPRYAENYVSNPPAGDLDMAIVVDVSQSMHTADVYPNRLQRAKFEIEELLERLRNVGVAVVVYAAKPHLYVPLTNDYKAVRFYVDSLDKLALPTAGNSPREALALAMEELSRSQRRKAIVFISDGDLLAEDSRNIAALLQSAGISLAVMGMGTVEGDVIPLAGGGWLYHNEKAVISRLQESALRQLADLSGGYYATAQDSDQDWKKLYDQGISAEKTGATAIDNTANVIWRELYQWALFPAVVLFFFAVIPYRFTTKSKVTVNTLLLLALCAIQSVGNDLYAQSDYDIQIAYTYFKKNDYQSAAERFAHISGYQARLGEGASRYRLKEYDKAIESFTQAVLAADSDKDRGVVLYNLGNSYFQSGNYAAAAQVYQDALLYRDHHAATLHNLAIAKSLKQLVEQRSRAVPVTDRAGRGPRQARAQSNLVLGDNNSVTLDQSEDMPAEHHPALANLDHEQLEYLINRGLSFVHVVVAKTGRKSEILWRRDSGTIEPAKEIRGNINDNISDNISDKNAQLWSRLFELEEGFQAPLDTPVNTPGTQSW